MSKHRLLHVLSLVFIATLSLSIMTTVMMSLPILSLIETVLEIVCTTIILYLFVSKIGMKVHISKTAKIVIVLLISLSFVILAIANLSRIPYSMGFWGERNMLKDIQLGNLDINKYHWTSLVILFLFPIASLLITEILKKPILSGALLGCLQTLLILSLWGLRLSTVCIVIVLNTVVICYLFETRFSIGKTKLFFVIAGSIVMIAVVLITYKIFYDRQFQISWGYYLAGVPSEMRGNIFRDSQFFGINTNISESPYIYYDVMSPMIVTLLLFGFIPFVGTILLAIIMMSQIFMLTKTVCRSTLQNIKKIITVALSSHMILQISMSILIAVGLPILPIHFPFYLQEYPNSEHFIYTVTGYVDIVILTCLLMMYMEATRKKQIESKKEGEVNANETACK